MHPLHTGRQGLALTHASLPHEQPPASQAGAEPAPAHAWVPRAVAGSELGLSARWMNEQLDE